MLVALLLWVVFGGIVGLIASSVMGEDQNVNGLMNVVVGIVGAVVGGFIFQMFGGSGVNGVNIYSFIVAFVGAVILLFVVKALRRV